MQRVALTVWFLCVWCACGDDHLNPLPPGSQVGRVCGRLCDESVGEWRAGVEVQLSSDSDQRTTVSDRNGTFQFTDVAAGTYRLRAEDVIQAPLTVTVGSDQVVEIGPRECADVRGALRGRVCDLFHGRAVGNASVVLNDDQRTTTTTDAAGYFTLAAIVPGDYELAISAPDYSETRAATVVPGQTVDLGPEHCGGSVEGDLCIGEYWVGGAEVYIDLSDGTRIRTQTNPGGHYVLAEIPPGQHTVRGAKNSFTVSFEITVVAGETVRLPEKCLRPSVRIAVITGFHDRVEGVLEEVGMSLRDHYWTRTQVDRGSPEGTVDLIHGKPAQEFNSTWPADTASKVWLTQFLSDRVWMDQYDVIFVNCGANVSDFWQATPPSYVNTAMANLQAWVAAGGSLYVSDFASDVVRYAFPSQLRFVWPEKGNGAIKSSVTASVLEPNLAERLGGSSTLTVAFPEAYWPVLTATQAPAVKTLLSATVGYYDEVPANPQTTHIIVQPNTPLLVYVNHGEGRVLFTNIHIEVDAAPQPGLREVLKYVVFEL